MRSRVRQLRMHFLCSFACDGCVWYTNRIPMNPSSGGSYATRNFYQPVLAKMYLVYLGERLARARETYAIMEAWLSFHDVTTVQNFTVQRG